MGGNACAGGCCRPGPRQSQSNLPRRYQALSVPQGGSAANPYELPLDWFQPLPLVAKHRENSTIFQVNPVSKRGQSAVNAVLL
jgi:hypothetical protein